MKKINFNFTSTAKLILAMAVSAILFSSCSSQYQWVKVKSADPKYAQKSDNYGTAAASADQATSSANTESDKPSSSLATASEESSSTGLATASPSEDDLNAKAQLKADELKSELSPDRKEALNSSDKEVRKGAITQTLHEQLAKNESYNKLSDAKKAQIEKVLSNKAAKMANKSYARNTGGFNTLLLVGLILLVIGLILDFTVPIVGLIFTIIGLVLAILGLVQMLA